MLMSIGSEGLISFFNMTNLEKVTTVATSSKGITAVAALSANEFVLGFESGLLQSIQISYGKCQILRSMVYDFLHGEIELISALPDKEPYFLVTSSDNSVTLWRVGRRYPLKILHFGVKISATHLYFRHPEQEPEAIVVLNTKMLVKVGFNHGGAYLGNTFNYTPDWNRYLLKRQKLIGRLKRENKFAIVQSHDRLPYFIEELKLKKLSKAIGYGTICSFM
jgi:WD40 repeat protein